MICLPVWAVLLIYVAGAGLGVLFGWAAAKEIND